MTTMKSDSVTDILVENPTGPKLYHDRSRTSVCMEGLYKFYKEKSLCDVTLVVNNVEFCCHKVVLAASSDYFRLMFTSGFMESEQDKITMNDMDVTCLEIILKYLYTGSVILDGENFLPLFHLANMLQIGEVQKMCVDYIFQNLTKSNCLDIYRIGKNLEIEKLMEYAKYKICTKYHDTLNTPDFLKLEASEVADILNFSYMPNMFEEEIYSLALKWVEHNTTRKSDSKIIYEAMKSVRFALLDEKFFRKKVRNKFLFRHCKELQKVFEQVIYYFNHPGRWHEVDLIFQPRLHQGNYRLILLSSQPIGKCSYGNKFVPYGKGCVTFRENMSYHGDWFKPPSNDGGYVPQSTQHREFTREVVLPRVSYDVNKWHGQVLVSTEVSCVDMLGGYTIEKAKGIGVKKHSYTSSRELQRSDTSNCRYEWCDGFAPMSYARAVPVAVALDKNIYVIGGSIKNRAMIKSVEMYDSVKNKWMKVSSLPHQLCHSCGVSYKGRIYVFGGEVKSNKKTRRQISDKTLCYDPERDKWHFLKEMKNSRALAGCAVFKNKIYVIGGMTSLLDDHIKDRDSGSATNSVEIYDPGTDTWSDGPDLPMALFAIGVAKYDGTIYCLGGINKQESSKRVFYLNDEGRSWLEGTPLSFPYEPCIHTSCSPVTMAASHDDSLRLMSYDFPRKKFGFPWDETSDGSETSYSDESYPCYFNENESWFYDEDEMTDSFYEDSMEEGEFDFD